MAKFVLSETITANANYPTNDGIRWYPSALNERGTLFVTGTFDGATAKLEASADSGTTWVDVGSNVEFTANGIGNFELFSDNETPVLIRLNVAGGGGSLSAKAFVYDEKR